MLLSSLGVKQKLEVADARKTGVPGGLDSTGVRCPHAGAHPRGHGCSLYSKVSARCVDTYAFETTLPGNRRDTSAHSNTPTPSALCVEFRFQWLVRSRCH